MIVERYTPSARHHRGAAPWIAVLRVLLGAFLLWVVAAHCLIATWRIDSVSMSPTLRPSDRIVVSPLAFGIRIPFSRARLPGLGTPARGDLVVIEPPYAPELPAWKRILEPLVAFFTLQRATIVRDLEGARIDRFSIKRVIGLPGDTVRIRGYRAYIRPAGAVEFAPEEQLLPASLQRRIEAGPADEEALVPFASSSSDIRLGQGEYFVLGDNRAASSDSRSWGVLKAERIHAKVILRYWPPRSVGRL